MGSVLSMSRVALLSATSPFTSVAPPLTVWSMPSLETVCGLEQLAIANPPAVQVHVTVTFVWFQPAPFAAGNTEDVTVGGATDVNVAPFVCTPPTGAMTLPVATPLGTMATI